MKTNVSIAFVGRGTKVKVTVTTNIKRTSGQYPGFAQTNSDQIWTKGSLYKDKGLGLHLGVRGQVQGHCSDQCQGHFY